MNICTEPFQSIASQMLPRFQLRPASDESFSFSATSQGITAPQSAPCGATRWPKMTIDCGARCLCNPLSMDFASK